MFKDKEQFLSRLFLITNIVIFGVLVWECTNISIWSDEAFDLKMIQKPYAYFLTRLRDAAPPFHFTVLKAFVEFWRQFFPEVNTIHIAKFSSVFSYIILFITSNTVIRKRFGALAGSFCGLLCITMPSLFRFGTELRMYSWAVLISFLWFVAFYEYLENETLLNGIIITVLGTLGVFTHYYIVFGVAYSYICFFILCVIKKNYKSAIKIVGVGLGSSILFSPWIYVAYRPLVKVANNFWLPEVTKEKAARDFFYPFKPDVTKFGIDVIGAVLICIIIVYFVARWIKEENSNKKLFVLLGITMPFVVATIGVFIGKYVFSVFQPRYIMVVMACFWIAIGISVTNLKSNKYINILIIVFLMGIALLDVAKNVKDEVEYVTNIDTLCDFLDDYSNETIVVDDSRVWNILPFYATVESLYDFRKDEQHDEIVEMIENGETVYYFHSNMYKKDNAYIDEMKASGYKVELFENTGIEYVKIEIYELSK